MRHRLWLLLAGALVTSASACRRNVGSAALCLPAQKGIDHRPEESPLRGQGTAHDDFTIPWQALLGLKKQTEMHETRPFLAGHPFRVERW
ncbi:MAG: hypothetical protein ACKODX_09285 [Gemmata sp.]